MGGRKWVGNIEGSEDVGDDLKTVIMERNCGEGGREGGDIIGIWT